MPLFPVPEDVLEPILERGWITAKEIAEELDVNIQWVVGTLRDMRETHNIEEMRKSRSGWSYRLAEDDE